MSTRARLAIVALLGTLAAGAAAAPPAGKASAAEQKRLQAEQRELRERLARVQRQLAQTENQRSAAADALAAAETAISQTQRRLRELEQAHATVQAQLAALAERSRRTAAAQSDEERQLGRLLRVQVALAQDNPWQRLVDGTEPNALARDHALLARLAQDRLDTIAALHERRTELAALQVESRARQDDLAAIARDEEASRARLAREQAARRQALDQLTRQAAGQRQSLATLERNDQRLTAVLDEIAKVLAEQARRDAQRAARRQAEQARRQALARQSAPRKEAAPAAAALSAAASAPPTAALPQGKLQLPVNGEVVARFGSPRRGEAGAAEAPSWKGVLIRAREGAEVRAVAAGRVVYADWLRGYGNLLVLDHGDGLLTIYGNNQTLFVGTGDRVAAGAPIAAVGASGGGAEPGLYFEVRVDGRPVDPLRWAAAR
ncbi:MAG: murein hydrolase activator EnvC family protein [Betaproteobacteria bacterium]